MAAHRTPNRRRVSLTEDVVRSAGGRLRVDRDKGIIRGVKVLGLDSANGRRYLPEAVARAKPLYEGRSVRIDHPRRPSDSREADDVFGWLKDVAVAEDGCLYGDLHYLKAHPMSARVCEAAERNPGLFGLSHNAQGDGETGKDGVFVVTEIVEVRSVDLVADPATTNGLFEGRGHRMAGTKVKLKAWMEAVKGLDVVKRKRVRKLLEDGMMDPDLEMEGEPPAEDAPAGDHTAALRGGFEASCSAVIQQALDGEMDPKEALTKLKELINAHGKLTGGEGGGGGEEEVEESEEDDEDLEECEDEEKPKMKESVELKLLRKEKRARVLCEEAGVEADSVLLESLARLPGEKAMTRMIEREKKRAGPAATAKPPRSGSGGGGGGGKKPLVESGAGGAAGAGIEDFMGALRR